jgi:GTPase
MLKGHRISLKDEKFTISLIGRPNVGKSSLFNALMGKEEALVDRMPGLTRDRREGISFMFDIPIRIVDTAGFEDIENIEDSEERSVNEEMMHDMIVQTRNALLYSDLAIFMIDSRSGIHHHDIELNKWILDKKFALKEKSLAVKKKEILKPQVIYEKPIKGLKESKDYKKELQMFELQRAELMMQKKEINFRSSFRDKYNEIAPEDIKIPKIIYVANKSENGFEGEIPYEAWKLNIESPLYISAIHGDGLNDLFRLILESIPEEKKDEFERRKMLRTSRFNDYKQMMLGELKELSEINKTNTEFEEHDFSIKELSSEFDYLNPEPEYNSDFDSDNEVNPLDTMTKIGYSSSVGGISTENSMKKKPIQLAVIGRPNVGKSTLVNSMIREDRVIANDLPGTTRDSVSIQWIYRGRRINLVDTAGIDVKSRNKSKIEELVKENMEKVLNYSHIALVLIDSMDAFTVKDLTIMDQVIEEGRGLIVAANKWDIVADKYK